MWRKVSTIYITTLALFTCFVIPTGNVYASDLQQSFSDQCVIQNSIQNPPERSTEELYQDIIVSLLMPKIDKQIKEYYKKYFTYTPLVYPYQVQFLEVRRLKGYRSFIFLLRIRTEAVVGPHIDVGLDQMTFEIHGGGDVQLKKFEHIRSYELPPNWQNIKKGRPTV